MEAASPQSAKVFAFGDINLHGFTGLEFTLSAGYAALVQKLEAYEGITLANLECALTTRHDLNLNKLTLHADPALLSKLPRIDLFSLANNHVSDAWDEGARDTMRRLAERNKQYFGYGRTLCEARRPTLVERNGVRLGFLGYSCLSTNGENYATRAKPGVPPLTTEYLASDIKQLKSNVDHVIVVVHWGEEHIHYPTPDQIAVAHHAIDFGASAVIGIHAHVIQGIERYKKGYVCYSLGNFIFANNQCELCASLRDETTRQKAKERPDVNRESIGVEFTFEKTQVRLSAVTGYKLDQHLLPNEIPLDRLHTNVNRINQKLETYVSRHAHYVQRISGPLLVTRFSSGKYSNHYRLKPIHGHRAHTTKNAVKRTLGKTLRYVTGLLF